MEAISKNRIKYIKQLSQKKHRKQEQKYIAEGAKIIEDLILAGQSMETIYADPDAYQRLSSIASKASIQIVNVDNESIHKASALSTASNAIAIIPIKQETLDMTAIKNNLTIALDNIQDPGNLGTIIRIADWFGIDTILCSKNTVDVFNNKVIQATMGAITRIKVHYVDLQDCLKSATDLHMPIYGTFLKGDNIYTKSLNNHGIIVMGNEGKGISEEIEAIVNNKITIPSFRQEKGSESLNVAMATSIICSEFKRKI
ncbi:RNA methyltransferase [Halosquirtibacter laminarini]|uniref:RNA methyltransferase n=1 Tax=Halosquirtibacter laminarini TaxID=3374600 RepID=A0AC61NC77_9BACT|nr:RNA methyltransferase [Prolixibacteraceae bacterium]